MQAMARGFFVTGTDTGVGKTWATLTLLHYFSDQGMPVVGMKPVASGCIFQNGRWINDDALQIQAHSNVKAAYELINPYAYEEPVSPHIAGKNNPVKFEKIADCFNQLQTLAEIVVVEGAGGWLTPVNDSSDVSDLARLLGLPVILVVAIKLGCINHARLTELAIRASIIDFKGWIAMCCDPEVLYPDEIIQTINHALTAPLLGIIPYSSYPDYSLSAQRLNI